MDFSRIVDGGSDLPDPGSATTGAIGPESIHRESIDDLLQRVERSLARIVMETPPAPSAPTFDSRQQDQLFSDGAFSDDVRPDSSVLQSAANAVYAHAANARNGDVEAYLAFYSQRFTPRKGSRETWEERIRERFALGEFAQEQVHRLAMRSISETQVEARFYGTGEQAVGKRLELIRDQEGWRVLLETTDIPDGGQE